MTGTLFFRYSRETISLVRDWVQDTENWKQSDTPEQDSLETLWKSGRYNSLDYVDPGPEWCWIFDDSQKIYGNKNPVVTHYQASRNNRSK